MTSQEFSPPERCLIVSLGSAGRRHLRNLRALRPGAEIGVFRPHSRGREDSVPEGANRQFATIDQAIAFRPRVAIVACPAPMHIGVATALADAGIHLLVEKPLAAETNGLNQFLDLCRARRVTLMTGYNLRFSPSLRDAKRLIEEGAVGRILGARAEAGQYLPDWRAGTDYRDSVSAKRALGGGALLELSHELDYLLWIFGVPHLVTARGGKYSALDVDVEDMVEVVLEYKAPSRLVSVHLDLLQRASVRRCRFIGDKGTMIWDGFAECVELFLAGRREWKRMDQYAAVDRNQTYLDELAHFLDCVAHRRAPIVDGQQAYDVLAVVDAARESMERGTSVETRRHG